MSTPTIPRFSISPYFAAYDPAKPAPVVTKTVERLLSDAGISFTLTKLHSFFFHIF
jgi:3-methyladenine DNA glycosylase Tag